MALTLRKRMEEEEEQEEKTARKKPKSSRGGVRHAFRKGSRFVLLIGDEGAILLYLKGNSVVSRQYVPDASEQNLEELRNNLSLDTKAPIAIAIDSMDQTYVQQTLPPVSAMSVKKLIDRRLQRDFAPGDIKGAITLGREKSGRKDWNFLMVSLERGRQLSMWLDFAFALPNRFQGIYLLAVEIEHILKKLEKSMGVPKEGTGSKWKFFVSHNKVGGFRQVVLRDGRIIFTRMSQPIGESSPEVIAGNIEQEMQSTVEYMKRLSFSVAAGLDVYIVASSAVKPLIDQHKFVTNNFNVLTPFEMAQHLGIEGATQPTDQFGDVVLAASIAISTRHVLVLSTPESKRFDLLYGVSQAQRGLSALLLLGVLGYTGTIASDIYIKYVDSEDLELARRVHQRNLNQLRDEIRKSDLDVENTGDIMDQYQLLLKQTLLPFALVNKVQTVIRPPIVIKSMEWNVEDKTAAGNALLPPKALATLILQFPGVNDADTFKAISRKILDDLKAQIKDYDIAFGKLPAKYTEVESFNINFDNGPTVSNAETTETPDVTLTLKQL